METKKVDQVDKNGHYLGIRIVEDGYSYPTRFNDRSNFERIMQQIKHAHTAMEVKYETN